MPELNNLTNHNRRILKIAVTGGIGSGKSVVAKEFNELGVRVIDTDSLVHQLYQHDKQLIREIATLFGNIVIDENGTVNRVNLGKLVFNDKNSLERLNKLVHPKVKSVMNNQIELMSKTGFTGFVIALVPLLIEAGMADDFDVVIVVTADEETRVQRVIKRDDLTGNEVKVRIKSQIKDKQRVKFADYIIDNNGSLAETKNQVKKIYNNINKNNPQKFTPRKD